MTFPARGTWIEIARCVLQITRPLDVPRKGNVDRNEQYHHYTHILLVTFPARGTWIEILRTSSTPAAAIDVPRKGNVDRNFHTLVD